MGRLHQCIVAAAACATASCALFKDDSPEVEPTPPPPVFCGGEIPQFVGAGFGVAYEAPLGRLNPLAVGGTQRVTLCDGTPIDDASVVSIDPAVVETLPFGVARGVSSGDSSLQFAIANGRGSFGIEVPVAVRDIASAAIVDDVVYFRGGSAHAVIELSSADGLRLVDESMRWIAPASGEPHSSFWTGSNWDRWSFVVPDTDGFDVEIESGAGERFVMRASTVDSVDEIVVPDGAGAFPSVLRRGELHIRCYRAFSRGRAVAGVPLAFVVEGPLRLEPSPFVQGVPECVVVTSNEVGSASIEVRAPGATFVDRVEVQ